LRLVAFKKRDEQCLALDITIDGVAHMSNRTPSLECISTKTAADTSPAPKRRAERVGSTPGPSPGFAVDGLQGSTACRPLNGQISARLGPG
jgi:hypothetical protein